MSAFLMLAFHCLSITAEISKKLTTVNTDLSTIVYQYQSISTNAELTKNKY